MRGRWRSRPVSRILFPLAGEPAGGRRPSLSEPRHRDPRAAYPGASGGPPAPCLALLRVGFAQPAGRPAAGELLPHRFTLAPAHLGVEPSSASGGRSVSVALSAG